VALTLAQALLHELDLSLNLARHRISVVMISKAPATASVTGDVVEDLLQHDVFCVVPSAPELAFQAIEEGIPMVTMQPDSLVAQQFRTIAEHLAQV
jgi:MinD-like ATPase involved in chromosome partitioning or flagellar assembly